jgi:predicted HTH domain antitoxin
MPIILNISDEILDTMKLPKDIASARIKEELAISLYERGIISMGLARKLSELSKWQFIELLAERGIQRHYGKKELMEDIEYGNS